MNLVIQASEPLDRVLRPSPHTPDPLAHLCAITHASSVTPIDDCAVRLENTDVSTRDAVLAWCADKPVDFAFVAPRRLSDFGLVAMDMDSTLITIECIDEIADFCGLKNEVAAITEASMRGELRDFSESLTRRVALLKGLDAGVLARVYDERLRLSPGAERMLRGVQAAGLATMLVSGGFVFFTERLKARLGFDFAHANTLEIVDGRLTGRVLGDIVDAAAKARRLREACAVRGIDPARAIAIGDGANDLPMMAAAGLSIAFRAKPAVREAASVAFNHVGLDGLLRLFD